MIMVRFTAIALYGVLFFLWTQPAAADMNDLSSNLRNHVVKLARQIGERNFIRYEALNEAAAYIEAQLAEYGYRPESQTYTLEGREYRNIIATRPGSGNSAETVVVGAHYDTVTGTPGADDNASGVAGLLELARLFAAKTENKTIRFVAFTNEEPPFFRTRRMGSRVFAQAAREQGVEISAMICLEMIGFYSEEKGSQGYPLPFMRAIYPSTADFIAVVGNLGSRPLVKRVERGLKRRQEIGVESIATFSWVPGVDFSDHYSFYKEGYRAVMITDTAFYRNPHYHMGTDTADTLDYDAMAQVVLGLTEAIINLSR
ncbi:MAG: M20/M25/M40 family metallo-hydrolase [bacterium]|nr:M20/M25/M40 family metallo-hydrolase [bacterium]